MTPLLFLFAAPLSQAEPLLTVDEAVEIALREGFSVRQAQILERRSQDLVDLAKAGAGLNVGLQSSYQRIEQRDVKQSPFGGGGFGPQKDTVNLSLNVSQYVDISGAVRRAVNQARLNRQAASFTTEAAKLGIKALVRIQALAILQAEENVDIREEEVRAAQERLDKAQARFRAEAIPRFDVLRFETELRRAEQTLVDARQAVTLAEQDLNNTLGRPVDTPFQMAPVPGAALPREEEAAQLARLALVSRPDLLASETNIRALREALAREKLGLAPSLTLSANHTETLTKVGEGSAKGQTVGGAVITLPIFDSGITRSRVRSAEKDIEAASIQLDQDRLAVALEVSNALTRLRSANEALAVALKTEELAREALRLAQLRYDEGVGTVVDVTDAQAQFTAARSSAAAARYATLAAFAQLQQAVGTDSLTPPPGTTAPSAGAKENRS